MARNGATYLMRAETAHARTLFLYGDGNGKRITAVPALAKAAGVAEGTIHRHLRAWEAEYEDLVIQSDPTAQALKLGGEQLTLHRKALSTLADQIEQIQWEIAQFDEITASLEKICDNFSLNTDNGDKALQLFSAYLSARGGKDNLRRTFMSMHKQYADMTGIMDLKDIQTTASKELEKGRVRIQLKKEQAESGPRDVTPEGGGGFAFDRS